MKKIFLLSISFSFLSLSQLCARTDKYAGQPENEDSLPVRHTIDGVTTEWPDSIFVTDKETSIKYAIDNDDEFLFIAIRVPEFKTQMKMMRMGMDFYIDTRGKKKESKGIEFPVKRDAPMRSQEPGGERNSNSSNGREGRENFDIKKARQSMALTMLYMKVFGFDESNPDAEAQGLMMPGKANVAFSWDSADLMNIEYRIPLSLVGEVAALNQKTISLGWKINGMEMPAGGPSGEGFSGGGRRGGGFSGGGGPGRGSGQADMENMMKEQKFWTKYIITFSRGPKGF